MMKEPRWKRMGWRSCWFCRIVAMVVVGLWLGLKVAVASQGRLNPLTCVCDPILIVIIPVTIGLVRSFKRRGFNCAPWRKGEQVTVNGELGVIVQSGTSKSLVETKAPPESGGLVARDWYDNDEIKTRHANS